MLGAADNEEAQQTSLVDALDACSVISVVVGFSLMGLEFLKLAKDIGEFIMEYFKYNRELKEQKLVAKARKAQELKQKQKEEAKRKMEEKKQQKLVEKARRREEKENKRNNQNDDDDDYEVQQQHLSPSPIARMMMTGQKEDENEEEHISPEILDELLSDPVKKNLFEHSQERKRVMNKKKKIIQRQQEEEEIADVKDKKLMKSLKQSFLEQQRKLNQVDL